VLKVLVLEVLEVLVLVLTMLECQGCRRRALDSTTSTYPHP
jgi:hypothetical protein